MTSSSPGRVAALAATALAAIAVLLLRPNAEVAALIVAGAGGLAVLLSGASDERLLESLRRALQAARRGQQLELPASVSASGSRLLDEIQRTAEVLQDSRARAEKLEASLGELQAELESYRRRSGRTGVEGLPTSLKSLAHALGDQAAVGEQLNTLIQEVSRAAEQAGRQLGELNSDSERSAVAVDELVQGSEQLNRVLAELGARVRDAVTLIERVAHSIKDVGKNVEALSQTTAQTSSSMHEMDGSIGQVQSNANETEKLSEQVARDAEHGAESILKTIGEIYRIKESSQEAVSVISDLGSRIEAIGQILSVIDEVAEQTNLLALNAAIIAAQAGEHGKGFAVVADEIKDLAERAGASTKEIADLIKTIQSESRNAIAAVERGAHNVDRGVQVSNEAERALKKILESTQKSTDMVRAIARATVEQAKGSKQVTDSITRIADTVSQIAVVTAEQVRGSEQIIASGSAMGELTEQALERGQECTRSGRRVRSDLDGLRSSVEQVVSAQRGQARDAGQASDLVRRLKDGAAEQAGKVDELRKSVD